MIYIYIRQASPGWMALQMSRMHIVLAFLGKTPLSGVLPLRDDRRTPASWLVQSEAVVYLENGLT